MPLIGSAYTLRKSKYGCEGEVMHLECEQGKYISPVRANFGRFEAGVCNPDGNLDWSTRCIQPTSLRQVNSVCNGKSYCSIDVTSSVFGDACPGTYKYLEVHYTCKAKVEAKSMDSNLPPWLLKMTATTAKPSTTSTTTMKAEVEATEEIVSEVIIEDFNTIDEPLMSVEDMERTLIDILGEDYNDISENIENEATDEEYIPVDRTLYVNLPLQEEEPAKQNVQLPQNTILLASLVSVLICTLLIFLAAVMYTKYKKSKGLAPDTARKEILPTTHQDANSRYHEYRQQGNNQCEYVYDSSSSTNSTVSSIYTSIPDLTTLSTVGSIYTTLPNGDKAIIIPMPSNQQYLRHILANPKLENFQQTPANNYSQHLSYGLPAGAQQIQHSQLLLQANNLHSLLQPQQQQQQMPQRQQQFDSDNIYYDIDQTNQF